MLNDFQIIARLFVAFRAGEGKGTFNVGFVDTEFIPVPWSTKGRMALKLQDEKLIEGLKPFDTTGNGLSWETSAPSITLAGLEYIATNKQVQKEITKLRTHGAELPAPLANAVISLSAEPAFEKLAKC